jgi:hypothetical protein
VDVEINTGGFEVADDPRRERITTGGIPVNGKIRDEEGQPTPHPLGEEPRRPPPSPPSAPPPPPPRKDPMNRFQDLCDELDA